MVRKVIVISFANRNLRAVDRMSDISEAVSHAEYNLLTRHGIGILGLYDAKNKVVLEMSVPDELAEKFTPGMHLRGVSKYLLEKHGQFYKHFLKGTRLLHYTVYQSFKDLDK